MALLKQNQHLNLFTRELLGNSRCRALTYFFNTQFSPRWRKVITLMNCIHNDYSVKPASRAAQNHTNQEWSKKWPQISTSWCNTMCDHSKKLQPDWLEEHSPATQMLLMRWLVLLWLHSCKKCLSTPDRIYQNAVQSGLKFIYLSGGVTRWQGPLCSSWLSLWSSYPVLRVFYSLVCLHHTEGK